MKVTFQNWVCPDIAISQINRINRAALRGTPLMMIDDNGDSWPIVGAWFESSIPILDVDMGEENAD